MLYNNNGDNMNNENNNLFPETSPVVKEVTETKGKNKGEKSIYNAIGAIVCVVIIILVAIIVTFLVIDSNNSKKMALIDKQNAEKQAKKDAIDGYGQALESVIDIQYNLDGTVLTIEEAKKRVHNENKVSCKYEGINEDRTVYLSE